MEPSARPRRARGRRRALSGSCWPAIAFGALIGWALGSAGIGALVGAVLGIPLGVYSVYRRYRGRV